MKAKYIRFDPLCSSLGDRHNVCIIFSEGAIHSDIGDAISAVHRGSIAASAGFVHITGDGKIRAFGQSVSLDLRTHEHDSHYLAKLFGLEPYQPKE